MNDTTLKRLLPHLLINYPHLPEYGLLRGKMGGAIFFRLYARKTGVGHYNDCSDQLIEDIYNNLNASSPVNFAEGLCGIGWGIEYMLKNALLDGDSDDILWEIDQRIMESDPCLMQETSLRYGLPGMLFYVLTRLKSYDRKQSAAPFTTDYLDRLSRAVQNNKLISSDPYVDEFRRVIEKGTVDYLAPCTFPDSIFHNLPEEPEDLTGYPLGIDGGLTGLAIKLLES